jgi:hypothetical protein
MSLPRHRHPRRPLNVTGAPAQSRSFVFDGRHTPKREVYAHLLARHRSPGDHALTEDERRLLINVGATIRGRIPDDAVIVDRRWGWCVEWRTAVSPSVTKDALINWTSSTWLGRGGGG